MNIAELEKKIDQFLPVSQELVKKCRYEMLKGIKVNKRKKYRMVFDVETIGVSNPRIYDLGFTIVDNKCNVVLAGAYLIDEVFDRKDFQSAYYASKKDSYLEKIDKNKTQKINFWAVRDEINFLISHFRISQLGAYNVNFDVRACEYSKNEYQYMSQKPFFNKNSLQIFDIWTLACQTICQEPNFVKFCFDNGFYSEKTGNCKTSAEVVYRYLTNNTEFEESHLGLDDSLIEVEILKHCLKKKKLHTEVVSMPWRLVKKAF